MAITPKLADEMASTTPVAGPNSVAGNCKPTKNRLNQTQDGDDGSRRAEQRKQPMSDLVACPVQIFTRRMLGQTITKVVSKITMPTRKAAGISACTPLSLITGTPITPAARTRPNRHAAPVATEDTGRRGKVVLQEGDASSDKRKHQRRRRCIVVHYGQYGQATPRYRCHAAAPSMTASGAAFASGCRLPRMTMLKRWGSVGKGPPPLFGLHWWFWKTRRTKTAAVRQEGANIKRHAGTGGE